jgi:SnoaL-like domain
MEPEVADLDRLLALEDIRRLKAQYFRCIDTKDWKGFTDCFAPDAVMDVSGEGERLIKSEEGIYRGAAAIGAWGERAATGIQTRHHILMPEIDVTSKIAARGIWAIEDRFWWPEGAGSHRTLHGWGYEYETYRKLAGAWRIQTSRFKRLRTEYT